MMDQEDHRYSGKANRGVVHRWCIPALLVVCVGFRVAVCVWGGIPEPRDDAALYFTAADQLAGWLGGEPLRQADILGMVLRDRRPVYPLLLALVYKIFGGASIIASVILNILIDCVSALLIVSIGNRFGKTIGFVSAILFAVSIPSASMCRMIMTETVGTCILLTSLLFFYRNQWLLCGLFSSIAYLTRPAFAIWPMIILVAGVFESVSNRTRDGASRCREAGFWGQTRFRSLSFWLSHNRPLIMLLLVMLVVTIAGKAAMKMLPESDALWSSRSGVALYAGYDLETDGWWITEGNEHVTPSLREGWEQVQRTLPWHTLRLITVKLRRLWLRPVIGFRFPWMPDNPPVWLRVYYWFYWITVIAGASGALAGITTRRVFPLSLAVIGISGLHALTYAHQRYAVVMLPVIYILGSRLVLTDTLSDWRGIKKGGVGFVVVAGIAVFGFLNDIRRVEWVPLAAGDSISRIIQRDGRGKPITVNHDQVLIDVRLLAPGSADFRVSINNQPVCSETGNTLFSVDVSDPWQSPTWLQIPVRSIASHAREIKVELISTDSPVAISRGSLKHLPEYKKSYNRWWVLGDARILGRNNGPSTDDWGIVYFSGADGTIE
ncbi:glycosyltransferase family 39 protein [bacterium]|nr:glycosyltransferase family 39 protein [candidate division CSSED10-310 bacterium]